jgi:hypothetical protein
VERPLGQLVRRVAIAVLGGALVALGILMIVTPGPAVLVVPAGLALLATEFDRPRRWRDAWVAWIRRTRARAGSATPE